MLPLLPDSGSQCESAENEEWFNRFNDILKSILLEFREGRPALDLCTQLLKTTNVVYEDAANVDKRGLTALTAISARLLFAEIEKKPSLQPAVSHLLRFVTVVFSSADSKEIAFSYIEGLLSTVPSFAKKLPSETVDAVGSVVNYVLLNANLNSEFYNVDKKYIVGFVFSVLLDLFSDESADSNVRIKVGELMLQMCTPSESYEIIAFLLPGICQSTVKVMCCIGIKSYKITTIALKVFTQVVTLVFGTENVKSRDEKWLEQSVQRIVQMINKISNRLSASSDHRVREVVLESMIYLHYKCQGIFESQIDEPLVDLLVNFSVDAYESLSSKAYSKLCVIRQQKNSFLFKRLTTQLHYLCSRLPYAVENSLSGEPLVLDRIYAVMHALGMEDLERVVRCSPHFVGQFLDGMASSVRIDMKRLKLSSEGVNTPEWKALSLYPLKFSVNAKHLNNIATELMQTECSEIIFDHIVDRISASTFKQDKIGYFLLSACFLHTGNSAISSYFQATLKTLRKLVDAIEFDVKDEKIEDLQTQHSDDSCLAALALTALGEAMAQVDPNKEQFKKLMLDVLYDTLQFCGSTNLVVKTAAEHVIVDLATTENVTQSALLLRFAPFLVHRLYVESRDFLSNLRSPVMLIQLLHHCDDPLLYGQVRFIMTDLLKALDRYDQQWTVLILRALLAFIQAVSNWYPDLTPAPQSNNNLCPMRDETEPDSDDDDEKENATVIEDEAKEEVPKPVTSVVEILMRTKHMISSPHLPIKILVLDILEASLRTVRNFENQLLPMIHQNWQGLVMRFKLPWADISTDDLLVATKALQIAVTMCELSRTFVYRKVVDDMWPLVARYLEIASKESRVTSKAYSHTSAFKYQMAVIKSAEPIVIHLSLKTEIEREKIVKLLEIYSGDEAQNCYLRDEAQRSLLITVAMTITLMFPCGTPCSIAVHCTIRSQVTVPRDVLFALGPVDAFLPADPVESILHFLRSLSTHTLRMSCSGIFILDLKGSLIMSRNYRGDVEMSNIDKFMPLLMEKEEEGHPSPVLQKDDLSFVYIKHMNIFLVSMSKKNVNVAMMLAFLYKCVEVFVSYFKDLEEESVRDNFVVIYELLDEMMDFGYPQTTEDKILQEYITQESHFLEVAPRPPMAVTNAVSWRSEGIKYRKNEVFLDVIESVNMLANASGTVLRSEIVGSIRMRVVLSGMPELRLGLNDKVLFQTIGRERSRGKAVELEDVKFHQCVRLSRFESERTISFIPPDGEFELMSYRLNTTIKPLIWVEAVVERYSRSRVEYMVKAKSQFKRQSIANHVEVIIPVPSDVMSPKFKTSVGSVKYVPESNAFVWTIRSFPGGREYLMRAHFDLPSIGGEEIDGKPPISVKFEIPYFTTSGLQVRYLKIIEKTGYQALPWVRYVTQNGDYQLRMQ